MPSLLTTTLCCLAACLAISPAASAAPYRDHHPPGQTIWAVGQLVHTTSGKIQGHAASNTSGAVSEYLGIPYALPPIGPLRFQPPRRYERGTTNHNASTIDAATFGNVCYQPGFLNSGGLRRRAYDLTAAAGPLLAAFSPTVAQSENCLTLNVWTKPQSGEDKKAVLFFIYGGGYTSGSSAVSIYNGKNIADTDDVVVVTINYRLNIFGFPGNPSTPPNLGILDQRLALEWVRDNIAAFHGDPSRITVLGQSAGGASADIHSYAFAADPIAAGFILESGVSFGIGTQRAETAASLWRNASAAVGCNGTNDATKTTACMLAAPAASLLRAATAPSIVGSFKPTIDDHLVFTDYSTRRPARRPLIVGCADNEPGLSRASPSAAALPDSYWAALQQDKFNCPAAARAAFGVLTGAPTWRYRWFGDFPNLRLTTDPTSGAWHGSELPVLFGTAPTAVAANTPAEDAVMKYLRGAWTTFAKDPVHGLDGYEGGWPRYSTEGETLVRLAFGGDQTGTNLAVGNLYDEGCPAVPVVTSRSGSQ